MKKKIKLYQEYERFNVYKVYKVEIVYNSDDILKQKPIERLIYLYNICKYNPPYHAHLGGEYLNVEE